MTETCYEHILWRFASGIQKCLRCGEEIEQSLEEMFPWFDFTRVIYEVEEISMSPAALEETAVADTPACEHDRWKFRHEPINDRCTWTCLDCSAEKVETVEEMIHRFESFDIIYNAKEIH